MVGRGGRDAADPGLATRGVVAELLAFVIAVDVSVLLQRRPGCDGVLALHDVTVICLLRNIDTSVVHFGKIVGRFRGVGGPCGEVTRDTHVRHAVVVQPARRALRQGLCLQAVGAAAERQRGVHRVHGGRGGRRALGGREHRRRVRRQQLPGFGEVPLVRPAVGPAPAVLGVEAHASSGIGEPVLEVRVRVERPAQPRHVPAARRRQLDRQPARIADRAPPHNDHLPRGERDLVPLRPAHRDPRLRGERRQGPVNDLERAGGGFDGEGRGDGHTDGPGRGLVAGVHGEGAGARGQHELPLPHRVRVRASKGADMGVSRRSAGQLLVVMNDFVAAIARFAFASTITTSLCAVFSVIVASALHDATKHVGAVVVLQQLRVGGPSGLSIDDVPILHRHIVVREGDPGVFGAIGAVVPPDHVGELVDGRPLHKPRRVLVVHPRDARVGGDQPFGAVPRHEQELVTPHAT
mmetsp:Transcript_3134/g.5845  ORF Transcript_3134/g.5845 Transcript_3134/m.5845 type:complete len:465 (+) Transcript_3134:1575-2969(+)